MSRRAVLAVAALGVAIAGYLYWSSDERQIRRLLDGVADAVSQEEGAGGVAGLAEIAGLTRYLAPDVAFEPGPPFRAITGAQDVVSTVGRLRAVMDSVELAFSEVHIAVNGDSASVQATGRLTLKDRDGEGRVETRAVTIALEKHDSAWVVTAARSARVIGT